MNSIKSKPENFQYFETLKEHLQDNPQRIIGKKIVLPREIQIDLPGNHKQACNLKCNFCFGARLEKKLDFFEPKLLKLVGELDGKVPYFLISGLYTEPLLNPYLLSLLKRIKQTGANFGLKTNGSLLKSLEEANGFISELCRISEKNDFVGISLDAGKKSSYLKIKKKDCFKEVMEGIRLLSKSRKNDCPRIYVTYLLNDLNSSKKEIQAALKELKKAKIDYLKFSIPVKEYNSKFDQKKQKAAIMAMEKKAAKVLEKIIKENQVKPKMFYDSPKPAHSVKPDFEQCIAGYYHVILGSDGYFYKCCGTASETFKRLRLGKIKGLKEFKKVSEKAQLGKNWPEKCIKENARCDRMSAEINSVWEKIGKGEKLD